MQNSKYLATFCHLSFGPRPKATQRLTHLPFFDNLSYFDRDVECVRRFFRKRFRYISDEFPRFQDVVPEHARKQTKLPKTTTDAEAVDEANTTTSESGDVRLDLLAKASGFGGSKQDRELEQVSALHFAGSLFKVDSKSSDKVLTVIIGLFEQQYMSSLRLSTTAGMIEVADSGDDETFDDNDDSVDDDDEEESQDDEDEDEDQQGGESGSDGEDDKDDGLTRSERKALKAANAAAADSAKPSRGAAHKALLDGDDSKIAQLVASDRAKAARRAEKHHGRKAHAGKGGRAHAGGKAKTGKARMISDSMDF